MASASSSFTGTENPLSEGGVWSTLSAWWSTTRKANGLACAVLANDCARRYTGVTFSADQASQVTLQAVPGGGQLWFQYVMCRMNSVASCYLLTTAPDVGANIIQLYKLNDSGTYTQIGTNITLGANMAANDVMRLEVLGTALTCKYNGSTVRTATDSTLASGQPGCGGWVQNAGSDVVIVKDWSATDIVAASGSPPMPSRTPSSLFML